MSTTLTYSSEATRATKGATTMTNLKPGIYRLSDGTLARLEHTPTGYQVTTADGTTFITDGEVR